MSCLSPRNSLPDSYILCRQTHLHMIVPPISFWSLYFPVAHLTVPILLNWVVSFQIVLLSVSVPSTLMYLMVIGHALYCFCLWALCRSHVVLACGNIPIRSFWVISPLAFVVHRFWTHFCISLKALLSCCLLGFYACPRALINPLVLSLAYHGAFLQMKSYC